jgi:membrane protein implicated in regulation of membrane protease activity
MWIELTTSPFIINGLFLLGLFFLYLELHAPGGYIAGLTGFICLVLATSGWPLSIQPSSLFMISSVLLFLAVVLITFFFRKDKKRHSLWNNSLSLYDPSNNHSAIVIDQISPCPLPESFKAKHYYQVKTRGEIWAAYDQELEPLAKGEEVQIINVFSDQLVLHIKKRHSQQKNS